MAKASLARVNQATKAKCKCAKPEPKIPAGALLFASVLFLLFLTFVLAVQSARSEEFEAPPVEITAEVTRAEPTQEQIEMTYALVWGLVAHKFGLAPERRLSDINAPVVTFVSKEVYCERFGRKVNELDGTCSAGWAYQLEDNIVIRDDIDWADAQQVSILAHEYVHFFRWVKSGAVQNKDCGAIFEREMEAYAVQAEILAKLPNWGTNQAETWLYQVQRLMQSQRHHCMLMFRGVK